MKILPTIFFTTLLSFWGYKAYQQAQRAYTKHEIVTATIVAVNNHTDWQSPRTAIKDSHGHIRIIYNIYGKRGDSFKVHCYATYWKKSKRLKSCYLEMY